MQTRRPETATADSVVAPLRMLLTAPDERLDAVGALMRDAASVEGRVGLAIRYHLRRPGKQMRARLALASGTALSVAEDDVVKWATACELVHNASLVHDDIHDGDELRRGQEAVWRRFGKPVALLVGDQLLNASFAVAADISFAVPSLVRSLSATVTRLVEGQSADIYGHRPTFPTFEQYLDVARGKTGPLLALPVEGPMHLAGASTRAIEQVRRVMGSLGAAFQIQDDVDDLLGKDARAAGSDVRARVWSAPLRLYQASASARRQAELQRWFARSGEDDCPDEVDRWVRRVLNSSAVDACRTAIDDLMECALHEARSFPRPIRRLVEGILGEKSAAEDRHADLHVQLG